MKSLTSRQRQILGLIRSTIEQTGIPPTRADICDHFNFRSPTAAEDHLRALARKGEIELLPGRSRGIRLTRVELMTGLPLIGRVAAGEPILAEQNIEDHFDLDPNRFKPRADYLLKVRGHSMRDAGILNGDLLAVHRTLEVHSGQIIVARLGEEVTVKRFRRRGNQVTLHAENPDFDPIVVDLQHTEFVIEGLGVGVVRTQGL
jgi:repressor LexA